MQKHWLWLVYAITTVVAWGIWGALISRPTDAGFPETLVYVVWSLTMIPPALIALWFIGFKLEYDAHSVLLGCAAGFTGAGGQLILFKAVNMAPAYLVFPFVALSPMVTILMAALLSGERVSKFGVIGIILALVAGLLVPEVAADDKQASGLLWVALAILVLLAWGVQGFIISHANTTMRAESIFFYMMITGLMLAPIAWFMTDFSQPINWGWAGPYQAAAIQVLNSIGALLLVYAFRYGKAMIVAPLINAGAPVVTVLLSMAIVNQLPNNWQKVGIVLAILAAGLMAIEGEKEALDYQVRHDEKEPH